LIKTKERLVKEQPTYITRCERRRKIEQKRRQKDSENIEIKSGLKIKWCILI